MDRRSLFRSAMGNTQVSKLPALIHEDGVGTGSQDVGIQLYWQYYCSCRFAFLIYTTGLYDDPSVNGFLLSVAEKKTLAPTMQLFFRGILCNSIVCLAFFLPMSMKGDGPKMFAMMLFVFCFFISGYEHSIANMCTFAISMVLDQPESVTFSGVIHNLIPVTIGNLIGGGIMMGWMY